MSEPRKEQETLLCMLAGCDKQAVVRVGPFGEPMCSEHYQGWLHGARAAVDAALNLMGDRREPRS